MWKTEKVGKGEKHTLGPGLWQKKKKKKKKKKGKKEAKEKKEWWKSRWVKKK